MRDTAVALILEEQRSKYIDLSWGTKGESMTSIKIMKKRAISHIIRIVLLMQGMAVDFNSVLMLGVIFSARMKKMR